MFTQPTNTGYVQKSIGYPAKKPETIKVINGVMR